MIEIEIYKNGDIYIYIYITNGGIKKCKRCNRKFKRFINNSYRANDQIGS